MKKLLTLPFVLALALCSITSPEAQAASQYTTCNYNKVAGAPWASAQRSSTHSGHIQCDAFKTSAVGYYKLISQTHHN